jgi:hypothetical protein
MARLSSVLLAVVVALVLLLTIHGEEAHQESVEDKTRALRGIQFQSRQGRVLPSIPSHHVRPPKNMVPIEG